MAPRKAKDIAKSAKSTEPPQPQWSLHQVEHNVAVAVERLKNVDAYIRMIRIKPEDLLGPNPPGGLMYWGFLENFYRMQKLRQFAPMATFRIPQSGTLQNTATSISL